MSAINNIAPIDTILKKHSHQLSILQKVNQLIASEESTEDTLLAVMRYLLDALECFAAQIYRLSTSDNELWLYLEVGSGAKLVTQTLDIFSTEEVNIVSDAARSGKPVYVPNVHQGSYAYFTYEGVNVPRGSELTLPLKYSQKLLGVLRFENPHVNAFDDEDITFLVNLSHSLASKIRNNQMIQQLQDSIQEVKMLYKLDQDNQQVKQIKVDPNDSIGYQYDKVALTKTSEMPQPAKTAITQAQKGITTLQKDDSKALIAPIQLQGEVIGVLGIEDVAEGDQWSNEDISLLEEISSQVALAIENSRLLQETQERTKELSLLFEATRQLSETIDLKQIYTILLNHTMSYLGADRGSIWLLNETKTHFEAMVTKVRSERGELLHITEPRKAVIEEFPSLQQILRQPRFLIQSLSDPALELKTKEQMTQNKDALIYTLTKLPLGVRNNLVGILEIAHFHRPRTYTRNELQVAQALIAQVTVAIENAQLFQQTQMALSDTEKLYEISRDLVESTSVEDIFNTVLANVKTYDVDRVSISLLDRSAAGEIESVTIVATWDRDPERATPVVGSRFSTHNFSLVRTFAQPPFHPLISHDLRDKESQDERMDEDFRLFAREQLGAVTSFSAPMFLGTEYKGVLSLYTRKSHIYTEQEIRIYQTLADQAIIAIENHRLLEATRRERDRASLLYELGQKLSRTINTNEVKAEVTVFAQQVGATHCELYITDGGDFAQFGSTIPERKDLSAAEAIELAFSRGPEALALSHQGRVVKTRGDIPATASLSLTVSSEPAGGIEGEWPLEGLPGMPEFQTFVSIPFYSQRSTVFGVLTCFRAKPDSFTEDQISTFESIAAQTSAALENVWLLEQTNMILGETELLYNITRGFNSAQTTEDLLTVLVEGASEIDVDFMAIASIPGLTSKGTPESLYLIASWQRLVPSPSPEPIEGEPGNPSPLGSAIANPNLIFTPRQCSFIDQIHAESPQEIHYEGMDPSTQATLDTHLGGARSLLCVPLVVGRNWLGVLLLASQTEDFSFKYKTINQIFTMASQAAVVMQNLQLVEETQKNLYNSEILSNLGQQLLAADTVETIYDLASTAIASTEPDRGIAILMYDQLEGGIELEMVALWNNPRQSWPDIPIGARFSTADLGLGPLLKTGLTVVSNNATQDERFEPMLRQLLMMMQINILVAVPLWVNKDVAGFILIGNETFTSFPADTVRLYEDISVEASGALENRRLFDEAQFRAWQLQTAAEISQAVTSYLDLDTLLSQSAALIRERFDFYHVFTYLVDEYQRYAIIQAAAGEMGQTMLEMKHKVAVGSQNMIGLVTGASKSKIALDVGEEAVVFDNPLLSRTRSEMTLPLIAQGRVIGAIDVHSARPAAFAQSDIAILQSMANQIANAIEAARSFQESKKALEEVSKLHEHYLRDQWETFLKKQKSISGYHLTDQGLILIDQEEDASLLGEGQALEVKQPVIIPVSPKPVPSGENKDTVPLSPEAAVLVAPITFNGQAVLGTVEFEIPGEDIEAVADEDTLRIIEAITSQAAQAVESARLFEQTQIAREEAEALYDVGRTLVVIENEQEMFNTVLSKMLSTLGLQQGGILFFDDHKESGKLHALFENGKPVVEPKLEIPIKNNASYQRLIETKRPLAIEDVATDPLVATVREMNIARGLVSLLLVPIIINDEVIGALGADSIGRKHTFTEREQNLAMTMADQLSIALQNRRLLEETKKRAVLLQASFEVGRVATSILDRDLMLDKAVELIKGRFGFHHVQIFLIDEAGQFVVLHKSTGEAGKKLLAANHKVAVGSQSVIGQVTHLRKPVVARSTDSPELSAAYKRNEFLPSTQAELAIPLQVGDSLIGALDVQSTLSNAFTDEEISTLETLTTQLAVAIQNAQAFKEQQETAERLKEIDKLKTQFLANMSHELRTPLNSIIGFSRVILKGIDGPLTELQKADLTSIHNSGQHLLGLINNILDLSKIEAGKMELNFEETEVEPIVKTVMATALALVKDRPVTLHQEVPDNLPTIWADPTRIRQVILNLVSNACKFTDEGAVVARVWAEGDKVVFSVSDTGIGIPEDQLGSIFEEFTQVDASTTRKVGGTGLGLPISRHFVEMHQGKIWVESKPGKGSSFCFYIPTKPIKDATKELEGYPTEEENPEERTRKVVVAIDDDPTVITLYKRFLEKQNYEVIGISYDQNIISQIKEIDPFAILLDVLLPGKDGWNIIQQLKEDSFTKDVPVIICSIVSDKNRGFSLGATDYLIKPITENELIEALRHVDHQKQGEVQVLVVDDQADDILLIRRILEAQASYNIIEASNGKEGLEQVIRRTPDLIILDLNMPEMDGFAMIEALKGNEKTRTIPIIIVSGEELSGEVQQRLTGQVEVLLHKGIFTENELLEDVSQALERIRRVEKATI